MSGSFEFRDYFSGKREEQAGLDRAVPRLGLPKGMSLVRLPEENRCRSDVPTILAGRAQKLTP